MVASSDEMSTCRLAGHMTSASVFVGTLNCGNKAPPADLSEWLPPKGAIKGNMGRGERQYDVVAVALQDTPGEAKQKASWLRSTAGAVTQPLLAKAKSGGVAAITDADNVYVKAILEHLGDEYSLVVDVSLIQMRLAVLVLTSQLEHISELEQNIMPCSTAAPKGVGAKKSTATILGDKGGLAARFALRGTSLCFVGAHLPAAAVGSSSLPAATIKAKVIDKLNRDCEAIMGVGLGNSKLDVGQFHHTFWFGDLNYKIDLSLQDNSKHADHAKHFTEVQSMINNRQWDRLWRADSLADQMGKANVFHEWEEEEKDFPPTFKIQSVSKGPHDYSAEEDLGYDSSRIPSWTDRVLWHSLPGAADAVECTSYSCAEGMSVGDHRPVMASFQLQLRPPPALLLPADPVPPLPTAEGVSENVVLANASSAATLSTQMAGQAQMMVLQLSCMKATVPRVGEGAPSLLEPYFSVYADPPALLGVKSITRPPRSAGGTVTRDSSGGSSCEWDAASKVVARVGSPLELAQCHLHLALHDTKQGATKGAFTSAPKEGDDRYIGHVSIALDGFGIDGLSSSLSSSEDAPPSFSFEAVVLRLGKPAGTVSGVLSLVAGHTAVPSMSSRVAAGTKAAKELPGKKELPTSIGGSIGGSFLADKDEQKDTPNRWSGGSAADIVTSIDPLVQAENLDELGDATIGLIKGIHEKTTGAAIGHVTKGMQKFIGGRTSPKGGSEGAEGEEEEKEEEEGEATAAKQGGSTQGALSLRERASNGSGGLQPVDARLPHFELNKKEWLLALVAALSVDDPLRLKSLYTDGSASPLNLDLRVQQCGADATGRCYGSIRGLPGCVLTAGSSSSGDRHAPLQNEREAAAAQGVPSIGLGDTLLHLASRNDKRRSVLALLAVGADPRALNREGRPPRTVAATIECRLEFVHHHKPEAAVRQRSMHGLPIRTAHPEEEHYASPIGVHEAIATPAATKGPVSAGQLFKKGPKSDVTDVVEYPEVPTRRVEVTLHRDPEKGLGLILDHDGDGEVEILVGDLVPESPAGLCGLIELDDELISVDGTEVYGMKFANVLELLAPDEVQLVFEREIYEEEANSFNGPDDGKSVKRRGSNINLGLKDMAEAEALEEGEMRSSGRLLKKGHGKGHGARGMMKRAWKMRYFVLDQGNAHLEQLPSLKYYKPAGGSKKLGELPLRGCTVEMEEETKYENHFVIKRGGEEDDDDDDEEEEVGASPKKGKKKKKKGAKRVPKGERYKAHQFRAGSRLLCEQWVAAIQNAIDSYEAAVEKELVASPTIGGIFGSRGLPEQEGGEEKGEEEGKGKKSKEEKKEEKKGGKGAKKEWDDAEKKRKKEEKEEAKAAKEAAKAVKEATKEAAKKEKEEKKEAEKKEKEAKKEAARAEKGAKKGADKKEKEVKEEEEEELLVERIEVTLHRDPEKGLGLILDHDGDGEVEVLVGDMVEGSPAFTCGKIEVDDELVQVNGQQVYGMRFANVLELLAPDEVQLVFEREADPDADPDATHDSSATASKKREMVRRMSNANVKAELMREGGLLTKARGKIRRNWKRRYFILDVKAGKLKHYHSKKSKDKGKATKKSGELELKGCEVTHLKGSKHENHFQVLRPRKEGDEEGDEEGANEEGEEGEEGKEGMEAVCQLRAEDYDSMLDWISDINKAIEMQEIETGATDLADLDIAIEAEQVDDDDDDDDEVA
jgi:hypothetical protein